MTGYAHHLAFDFKSGIRDTSTMLMNYLFPVGFFLMMGLFMPTINPGFLDIMIPGMILFAIMSGTLMTLPSGMIDQKEAGILRSYRVNGVPAASLVTIPVLGSLVHMIIVSAILTVAAALVFGARVPAHWPWFAATVVLAALCLASLSMLIGIVSPSSRTGVLLAQLVYVPSVVLGGLMVPEGMLPAAVGRGALILPASNAMRAFNALAMGDAAAGGAAVPAGAVVSLAVLAASVVVNLALCLALFQWDPRQPTGSRNLLALLAVIPFAVSVAIG